jgi:hypothetical protein
MVIFPLELVIFHGSPRQGESEALLAEERFEVDQPTRLRVKFLSLLGQRCRGARWFVGKHKNWGSER